MLLKDDVCVDENERATVDQASAVRRADVAAKARAITATASRNDAATARAPATVVARVATAGVTRRPPRPLCSIGSRRRPRTAVPLATPAPTTFTLIKTLSRSLVRTPHSFLRKKK